MLATPSAGLHILGRLLRRFSTALLLICVQLYRKAISPWLAPSCRYQPTCSDYALQAIRKHGPLTGSMLAIRRIARCHPLGGHGYDPVPEKESTRQTAATPESIAHA